MPADNPLALALTLTVEVAEPEVDAPALPVKVSGTSQFPPDCVVALTV
jgi:hypothetical protein